MIQQTNVACRQLKFKFNNSVYDDFLGSFHQLFTQRADNTAVHWSHKLTKEGKQAKHSDVITFLLAIHLYIKKYNLICSFTMVLEIMKRMITKLCQLYGVSHYLCIYSEHVSLIQSTTAETVQLCNTLTTTWKITENFMQKKKKSIIYIHITLFVYLFHPCQNLQSGPLHWRIQYKNAILYAFSKTHNKENNIVAVSYRVLAFAKASSLLYSWSSCSYGIRQATHHQLAQRLKMDEVVPHTAIWSFTRITLPTALFITPATTNTLQQSIE
jgi:hypothetical protein